MLTGDEETDQRMKTIFTLNSLHTAKIASDGFLRRNPRYNLRWYKCYSDHVNAYKLLQLRWKHNINRVYDVHAVCIHETDWVGQAVSVYGMKDSLGVISTFPKHFAFIQRNFNMKFQWTVFNFEPKPKQKRKRIKKYIYCTQLNVYILNYKLMRFSVS